ncbi:MAG: tetratricopeptide repeat protein, partial [Pseudomonadota bacterium]
TPTSFDATRRRVHKKLNPNPPISDQEREALNNQLRNLQKKYKNITQSYQEMIGELNTTQSELQKLKQQNPDHQYDPAIKQINQGNLSEADALLSKLQTKSFDDIVRILQARSRLAKARFDDQQAISLSRQALKIAQEQLGGEHPHTASTMNNLALLYLGQNRFKEAEALYKNALKIMQTELGDNHPDTSGTMNNLALLYYYQNKLKEAKSLFEQALEIMQTELGDNHPDTANTMGNLASLYYVQNRLKEAESLYK